MRFQVFAHSDAKVDQLGTRKRITSADLVRWLSKPGVDYIRVCSAEDESEPVETEEPKAVKETPVPEAPEKTED